MIIPGIPILGLLQSGHAHDLEGLGQALGYAAEDGSIDQHTLSKLCRTLDQLRAAGLVVFDTEPENPRNITGPITLSKNWERVYPFLGLSLSDMLNLGPGAMVVKPNFIRPERTYKSVDIFVLMPLEKILSRFTLIISRMWLKLWGFQLSAAMIFLHRMM
jgi:hypothetical protein